MNDNQRVVLGIYAALFAAMLLYPPWTVTETSGRLGANGGEYKQVVKTEYAWLHEGVTSYNTNGYVSHCGTLAIWQLLAQWVALTVVAHSAYLLLRKEVHGRCADGSGVR